MCLRKKMFGSRKSKHQKESTLHESIQHLRGSEEKLRGKVELLKANIAKEFNVAKQEIKSNKKDAKAALIRKKRYEKQLELNEKTLTNIKSQLDVLENETIYNRGTSKKDQDIDPSTEVIQAMDTAAIRLKSLNKKMDADKVASLMKDVAEHQRNTQAVSDVISSPTVGFECDMDYMDQDELLAELEQMEQKDLNKKLSNTEELAAEPPSVLTEMPSIVMAKGDKHLQVA
ncbi:hypothetical protein CHS0354_024759 [Potamilus streckersoni]|uniref:Uncharacterized protein n=1 Tax=Potamilus streckersoni TaxID=2493646 RepID=A0AAE0RX47_9BIVA|nr:hypothetical protein CHS0354_024759 [Potamilus streckersoni]